MRSLAVPLTAAILLAACVTPGDRAAQALSANDAGGTLPWSHGPLQASPDGRFFQHADGTPFFWLGDTPWLLFRNLDRDEMRVYLDDRAAKGFNVIQAMGVQNMPFRNRYGDPAVRARNDFTPVVTPGDDPADPDAYDFWDHVDYCVEQAAARGIYVAIVPSWGSNVQRGRLDPESAAAYGAFLGERYRDAPNIVWLIGGDTRGDENTDTWIALAEAIKRHDPGHLMTFHPFGRRSSAEWFHDAPWLDFDMFQSGHRNYAQIENENPLTWVGEDNWYFVEEARAMTPPKPVIDGEPSYEGIPHGLHDWTLPLWQPADARRYAWWSVMAGAAGHTYGHGMIIGLRRESAWRDGVYFPAWNEAIHAPGAVQMQHVRNLILSRPFFARRPDPQAVVDPGKLYDRVLVSRGDDYLFAYVYTGRSFTLNLGRISGDRVRAWWYSPRNGHVREIGEIENTGRREFDPPAEPYEGNDWVLILDDVSKNFPPPGDR
jgi:hypothetical protein